MTLPFAQFVWIVEFATKSQWAVGQVAARAVIDASASLMEVMPLWLLHGCKKALVLNRQSLDFRTGIRDLQLSDIGHKGFTRMEQNLRPTRTK